VMAKVGKDKQGQQSRKDGQNSACFNASFLSS